MYDSSETKNYLQKRVGFYMQGDWANFRLLGDLMKITEVAQIVEILFFGGKIYVPILIKNGMDYILCDFSTSSSDPPVYLPTCMLQQNKPFSAHCTCLVLFREK
jgi:hypothetical protein